MSPIASTKIGSTLPRAQRMRQRAPSAATMALRRRHTLRPAAARRRAQHLDEILEQVARAAVAVRLEGQHQAAARIGGARGGQVAAISTGWWP
jgi:hypothetical protein